MLLRVTAPKFSSGPGGRGKATGLGWRKEGLLSPEPAPPLAPLREGELEGQEVGGVSRIYIYTRPGREVGALSLPCPRHPYPGPPLLFQPYVHRSRAGFSQTPARGVCGAPALPGGGAARLTCSQQLPVHTQRVACNGPAAETGGSE